MGTKRSYDVEQGPLTAMEKIQAISWAAKQEGMTYGQFSSALTDEKRDRIFAEYQAKLSEDRKAEQQRLEEFRRRKEPSDDRDWIAEDRLMANKS